MKIAISGPDGAGKSSVCAYLQNQLADSMVIYAGKADFYFKITALALILCKKASKFGYLPSFMIQQFIYYPLEYIDSWFKFYSDNEVAVSIYDRYPVDRIILKYSLKYRFERNKITAASFYFQYPFLWLWAEIYKLHLPAVDILVVLLPEPAICFERSAGQYLEQDDAQLKIDAYRMAIYELPSKIKCKQLNVNSDLTVEDICHLIRRELDLND